MIRPPPRPTLVRSSAASDWNKGQKPFSTAVLPVDKATTRQPEKHSIAFLLAALSALGPFSIDTYLPSFHEIAEKLGATQLQVQQTLAAYLVAFAVMTLWHGAISDRFGRRRVILIALACFGLASAGCAVASSIEQLWFWRAMQGVTAGAGMVVSRAIVRDLYDGADAQRCLLYTSDAADERSSVDLGGRPTLKKKKE